MDDRSTLVSAAAVAAVLTRHEVIGPVLMIVAEVGDLIWGPAIR